MQKATTPKRFYIDHSSTDKVEVRAVSCTLTPKHAQATPESKQAATQTERLFSTGRLVRGGFLRKR